MSNGSLHIRRLKRSRDWSLGLLMLSTVVLLWVLSSFLVNSLFDDDNSYNKPFFITYINTSMFSLYLIFYWIDYRKKLDDTPKVISVETFFRPSHRDRHHNYHHRSNSNPSSHSVTTSSSYQLHSSNSGEGSTLMTPVITGSSYLAPLSIKETVFLAGWFCSLWFFSNLVTNASLMYTSVSSQTILSSTSSFFTILIGYFLGVGIITSKKSIALVVSFIGVILVTDNDNPEKMREIEGPGWANKYILFGNLLALLGALCYGIYSILLKLKVKKEDRMDMRLFFGSVGLFNIVFLWPPLIILHYFDIETFELPSSFKVWMILFVNCFISFLADFLWAKAMLLTSPLTVTVGLSLTIPVAMVGDFFIKHKVNSFIYIFGAIMICCSFFIVNKDEFDDSDTVDYKAVEENVNHEDSSTAVLA